MFKSLIKKIENCDKELEEIDKIIHSETGKYILDLFKKTASSNIIITEIRLHKKDKNLPESFKLFGINIINL